MMLGAYLMCKMKFQILVTYQNEKGKCEIFFSLLIKTISHKMTEQSSHFSPDTSDNTVRSPLYLFYLLSVWIIVTVLQIQQAGKKCRGKKKDCGAWCDVTK